MQPPGPPSDVQEAGLSSRAGPSDMYSLAHPCHTDFLIQVPQIEMSQIQASQVPGQRPVCFPLSLYNLKLPIHLFFSPSLSPGKQGAFSVLLLGIEFLVLLTASSAARWEQIKCQLGYLIQINTWWNLDICIYAAMILPLWACQIMSLHFEKHQHTLKLKNQQEIYTSS